MRHFHSKEEIAGDLRTQAETCRGLASRARTVTGATALTALAAQFDAEAHRISPLPT